MIRFLSKTLFASFVLLLSACSEPPATSSIDEFRIELFNSTGSPFTDSTGGRILDENILYRNFNLSNYSGLTEIIFDANLESGNANSNCIVELYDLTNGRVLEESILESNCTEFCWIESTNILRAFPFQDIDLTIRLRTSNQGTSALIKGANLYLIL